LIAAPGSAQWCALNVESTKSNLPAENGNDSAGTVSNFESVLKAGRTGMVSRAADHVVRRINANEPKVGTALREFQQQPPRTGTHIEN